MKDRFDLENEIMKLHSFADDIELVVKYLLEDVDCDPKIADTSSNALIGIQTLLTLHADKMMDTMSQAFGLDQYRDQQTSELFQKYDLTNDDTKVKTKCCGGHCSNMTSFDYQ